MTFFSPHPYFLNPFHSIHTFLIQPFSIHFTPTILSYIYILLLSLYFSKSIRNYNLSILILFFLNTSFLNQSFLNPSIFKPSFLNSDPFSIQILSLFILNPNPSFLSLSFPSSICHFYSMHPSYTNLFSLSISY